MSGDDDNGGGANATPETSADAYAGFWRRLFAFLADTVVLMVAGYALGTLFFDQMAALGIAGRMVGWGLAILYFGVQNSRIAKGQTLGKRLLKVRVTGIDGHLLDPGTALVRAAVLTAPWFLNVYALAALSNDRSAQILGWAIGLVLLASGMTTFYLFLFNRPSRRSLHDLLCGSCTVTAASASVPANLTWPSRRVLMGLAVPAALLAATPVVFVRFFGPTLLPIYAAVDSLSEVMTVGVTQQKTMRVVNVSGSAAPALPSEFVAVSARLRIPVPAQDQRRELAHVAAAVLKAGTLAPTTHLVVSISYGFDLGFASSYRGYGDGGPVAAWKTLIDQMAATGQN
ncbi:RDD family protein [Nitrospirillum amazonense]|nr:RDD family protein [Nitrospirillum amazonense]MDG3442613.1 RDD family protein [Nitrospirillum amazonense]